MTSLTTAPLFIVFNIGAGAGDAQQVRAAIDEACAAAGRPVHLLVVGDARRIGDVAREAVRRARDAGGIVVAAGGDGTINAVAQAVLGSGCPFGVLPQGTFNYFSRNHGIPSDTRAALQVLLSGQPRPVQVGRVNDRVFLVNASLGLYPMLLEDREALKRRWGRKRWVALGAALLTLLRGHRQLRLDVEVHGNRRALRTPTLFVGNNALQLEQIGIPEAGLVEAGALVAIVPRPLGRPALLRLMLQGALGRLGEDEQVLSFGFGRLVVRSARWLRVRRMKAAADGEVGWLPLPIEFSVSPVPLDLICPAAEPAQRAPA